MFESQIHHIVKRQRTSYFLIQMKLVSHTSSASFIGTGHLYINWQKKECKVRLLESFCLSRLFMTTLTFLWLYAQLILLTEIFLQDRLFCLRPEIQIFSLTVCLSQESCKIFSETPVKAIVVIHLWLVCVCFVFHLTSVLVRVSISLFSLSITNSILAGNSPRSQPPGPKSTEGVHSYQCPTYFSRVSGVETRKGRVTLTT